MTRYLALAAALALAGCAGTPTTTALTTPQVIAKVQADWGIAKGVINVALASGTVPAADVPAVTKAVGIADAEVAALSSATAPTTVKAALADVSALAAALPPGTLPAAQQADLTLLLAVMNAGVAAG